eukprot:GHRQ01035292.1.p1 GENE.GHRQ01035292.1~~GHRQ01035292.1.p1  ORF type:complete len:139 (-),score=39.03 GHRQ01035292.1:344-760(-)
MRAVATTSRAWTAREFGLQFRLHAAQLLQLCTAHKFVYGCCRHAALEQVATAIRGAIILAKMSCIPIRRGYWGNKIGKVHTVPTKVTGKCGSVTIRLIPAPRGAGAPCISVVSQACTPACTWLVRQGLRPAAGKLAYL